MKGKRLLQTFRLYLTLSGRKRTEYMKRKKVFFSMGDNCLIMDRIIPLYAKLISIGNNVHIASNVNFVTHDIVHNMLNGKYFPEKNEKFYKEKLGCIEIGDNVFIGAGTRVLYNVRIGNNVIVGAGTLITKDIPDNCVVAGVPAKMICSFDEFVKKRSEENLYPNSLQIRGQEISDTLAQYCWDDFYSQRKIVKNAKGNVNE